MPDTDKRLSKLEQNYTELRLGQEHLQEEMQGLKDSLKGEFQGVRDDLKDLTTAFMESQKAPWQILISTLAVALTAAGFVGLIVYSDMDRLESSIDSRPTREEYHLMRETNGLEIDLLEEKIDKMVIRLGR